MRDALKNYLTLASGLTEVGRQRAVAASKALVAQGEATAEQVQSLAEDLLQTSRTNREMITSLVRSEVEKTLSRVGLATADEVQRLTKRLQTIEASVRDASGRAAGAAKAAVRRPAAKAAPAPSTPAAKKPAAKKPAAKKPAAKATKAPAKKPAKAAAAKKPAKATKPAKKATR